MSIDALMAGVLSRVAGEWIDYRTQVHTYLADGDRVAAFGLYSGTYKATGKSMQAYEMQEGKFLRMTQYVDTAMCS